MRAHSFGRSFQLPLVLVLVLCCALMLFNFSQYTPVQASGHAPDPAPEPSATEVPASRPGASPHRGSLAPEPERPPIPDECRTETFPDGRLRSKTYYRNGQPHGAYQAWHPNGRLKEHGQYRFGEPVGPWIRYDSNGRLEQPEGGE